jgi:hypothetical protein
MTTKAKTFPKKKTEVKTGVLQSEPKQKNPFTKSFGRRSNKPTIFQLIQGRKIRNGRVTYPIVYMIKAEDIIYDPIKGVNRKIRYIPGEASIYEDEQKKESKVRAPITFNEGHLPVSAQNPTLKLYLENCNANKDNPNRMTGSPAVFKLIDKERDAKKVINKEMKQLDAMQLALKMPISKLIGYAKVLGVNVDKSTEEIRYDMKVLAKKSPESFITGMDDPKTEIKEVIINSMEYGIINVQSNRVSWQRGTSKVLITHVPVGKDAKDHFAEFCLTDEGNLVLEEMRKQLQKFND